MGRSRAIAADAERGPALWAVALCAGVGVAIYFALPVREPEIHWLHAVGTAVAAALSAGLAFVPWVGARLGRLIDRLSEPSPGGRALTAFWIGVAVVIYFTSEAILAGRDMQPVWHDEYMYLLQARMLASGHLWMPQHPMADFFETFHVLVKPVYAPMYFPGTALAYIPAVVLNVPPGYTALLIVGAGVAMTYGVVAEMIGGLGGWVAALWLAGLLQLHIHGCMVLSHPLLMLQGMTLVWAYLRWRKDSSIGWALGMGLIAGWAAITRPQDALIWAVPLGAAMLLDMRRLARRVRWRTVAFGLLGAAPFLGLQLAFNVGVTGRILQTPYQYYVERNSPGVLVVGQNDAAARPTTTLRQKLEYERTWHAPQVRRARETPVAELWTQEKLPVLLHATMPWRFLLILLPACVLAAGQRRWIFPVMVPLFIVAYVPFAFLLANYPLVIAAAVAVAFAMAWSVWSGVLGRWSKRLRTSATLGLGCVLIAIMPPPPINPYYGIYNLRVIDRALSEIEGPAVVLFRYGPGADYHREPVYNLDVAWPDDARVIRAQDLGSRNMELVKYYAARQPERTFYIYDRAQGTLTRVGKAGDLANRLPQTQSEPRP